VRISGLGLGVPGKNKYGMRFDGSMRIQATPRMGWLSRELLDLLE
jgi:hypothetical protein